MSFMDNSDNSMFGHNSNNSSFGHNSSSSPLIFPFYMMSPIWGSHQQFFLFILNLPSF